MKTGRVFPCRFFALLLCGFSGVSPAAAALIYAASTGDDANSGHSIKEPVRTLAAAVRRAQPGDTIELRAGIYDGATISRPGSPDAWITLRSYEKEKVILEGRNSGPTLYFYHRSCESYERGSGKPCQGMYWSVEGLEIRGSPKGGGDGNAVKIDTPHVRLLANNLCCSTADVVKLVHSAHDVEILRNEVHHTRSRPGANAQGIDIVGAHRTRVARNFVHDINDIGMYAKGNARHTVFEQNRVERTWSHAIMLGQSTDSYRLQDGRYESYDGIIRDNVVRDTGWACLATSSSFNVKIYNNTCYNTGTDTHGSILISNESEIGQAGTNIDIFNNIVHASPRHPVIKLTSKALTDPSTLHVDHNIYWTRDGAARVRFTWRDRGLEGVSYRDWRDATRQDEHSVLRDPQLVDTTLQPSSGSPAFGGGVSAPRSDDENGATLPRCRNAPQIGARPPCRP